MTNVQRRDKYHVLRKDRSYFVTKIKHPDSTKTLYIIKLFEFLIDNIFAMFCEHVFQQ